MTWHVGAQDDEIDHSHAGETGQTRFEQQILAVLTLAVVEGGGDDDKLQDFHQVRDENPGGRKNGVGVWKIVHVAETHSDDTENTV